MLNFPHNALAVLWFAKCGSDFAVLSIVAQTLCVSFIRGCVCVFHQAGHFPPAALNQMIGGLVGQLLTGAAGQTGTCLHYTCIALTEINNIMSSEPFSFMQMRSQYS